MKKIIGTAFVVFCFGIHQHSFGQQAQQSSLYMYNTLYYNPAYAGTRGNMTATVTSRTQWTGFKGAPRTQYFSIHSPIEGRNISVGGYINHDKIGVRSRLSAHAVASSNLRINKYDDRISIGMSAGVSNYSNDFQSLLATHTNDGVMMDGRSVMRPNVGLGVYYYGKRHYIGLSVPTVLSWKDLNANNVIKQHFFASLGYVFEINSVFFIKPSALVKYVPGAPMTATVTLSAIAYEKYWAGLMVRSGEGIGVNLAYVINKRFTIGYAYDFPFNKLRTIQSGTHEILLQYDFVTKTERIFTPRYF